MTLEQSVHSNQPQGSRFVLVTGGAGYIATHTVVELASAGYLPVLLDNLSNSKRDAVRRVERIVGRTLPFYEADIRSRESLRAIFAEHPFEAVIHFAGLKAVGESVSQPLRYYDNNVTGTITLCEVMAEFGVKRLVFSSSATVYGDPASVPIRENFPVGGTTNPYGRSKYIVECILQDLVAAGGENWNIVLLRYFNPVGAHPSGLIGEDPRGTPNNLMPFIAQVAVGKRSHLNVFGNDYPTPDGTGVRDYIHVVDLAQGHVAALKFLGNESTSQRINESAQREAGGEQAESPSSLSSFEGRQGRGRIVAINLGTGRGYSVLEMTQAFEKASGRKVPYQIVGRRPGDIASCYADPALAKKLLGWQATRGIDEMCVDTWRWQQGNPDGY